MIIMKIPFSWHRISKHFGFNISKRFENKNSNLISKTNKRMDSVKIRSRSSNNEVKSSATDSKSDVYSANTAKTNLNVNLYTQSKNDLASYIQINKPNQSSIVENGGIQKPKQFYDPLITEHGGVNSPLLMARQNEIDSKIFDYHKGNISTEEFNQFIKEDYEWLKQFYTLTGLMPEDETEACKQILVGMHEYYSLKNNYSTVGLNFDEGAEIADKYGSSSDRDWVYYNSDYYYLAKDTENLILSILNELAKEQDLEKINYKERDIPKKNNQTFNSFNGIWNFSVSNFTVKHPDCKLDTNAVPPKGFKFFYKQNQKDSNDAVMIVSNGLLDRFVNFNLGRECMKNSMDYNFMNLVLSDLDPHEFSAFLKCFTLSYIVDDINGKYNK